MTKNNPKGIFGVHINIRSIPKQDEIKTLFIDSNLHFLGLTETWLHCKIYTSLLKVAGYNCYRKDRKTEKGGGVIIVVLMSSTKKLTEKQT